MIVVVCLFVLVCFRILFLYSVACLLCFIWGGMCRFVVLVCVCFCLSILVLLFILFVLLFVLFVAVCLFVLVCFRILFLYGVACLFFFVFVGDVPFCCFGGVFWFEQLGVVILISCFWGYVLACCFRVFFV